MYHLERRHTFEKHINSSGYLGAAALATPANAATICPDVATASYRIFYNTPDEFSFTTYHVHSGEYISRA